MKLSFAKDSELPYDVSLLLNSIAPGLRCKYNEIIQTLSLGNEKKIDWWVSELASRNTYTNSLFINICYLSLVDQLLKDKYLIEEIEVDSKYLAKIFQKYFEERSLLIKIKKNVSALKSIKSFLKPFYDFVKGVTLFSKQFIAARIIRFKSNNLSERNLTLVDIFLFDKSFKDNELIDRYYNKFHGYLSTEEEKNIFFVPTFFDIKSYKTIFKKIKNSDQNFLLKEQFLKFYDYLYALFFPLRAFFLKPKKIKFNDFDIYPILKDIWLKNLACRTSMEALLKYRFAKRIFKKSINIRLVIDWFENQIIDKGANMGFRCFYPDTPIIGYDVGVLYKYYLCCFPLESELINRVIPTNIAVCGEALIDSPKEFCHELKVELAPAFRYTNIWKKREEYPNKEYFTILLLLPGFTSREIKDILQICSNLDLKSLPKNSRFWIKKHPSWSNSEIIKCIVSQWPDYFEFVDGEFSTFAEKSDVVITNISTASLETISKGIPVIIIGSKSGLTQNPIPETIVSDIWQLCHSTDELTAAINFYANSSESQKKVFEIDSYKIRKNYFEPVTREGVRKFLRLDN